MLGKMRAALHVCIPALVQHLSPKPTLQNLPLPLHKQDKDSRQRRLHAAREMLDDQAARLDNDDTMPPPDEQLSVVDCHLSPPRTLPPFPPPFLRDCMCNTTPATAIPDMKQGRLQQLLEDSDESLEEETAAALKRDQRHRRHLRLLRDSTGTLPGALPASLPSLAPVAATSVFSKRSNATRSTSSLAAAALCGAPGNITDAADARELSAAAAEAASARIAEAAARDKRTLFVGNVPAGPPLQRVKLALLRLVKPFGSVETLRFRSFAVDLDARLSVGGASCASVV